jgi:hypothetical protein
MPSSEMLHHVALVSTDVSEEHRVTRIGELGTLAVNSNGRTLQRRRYIPLKRRFLQKPHGVKPQKTVLFIVTTMKTSNLTKLVRNTNVATDIKNKNIWLTNLLRLNT